jgi:hypothetical protein
VRNKIKHRQKSARQGNLRHPRASEISLSCTFANVRFYISHWCKRTLPSTDPRSDHLVTLLHLLRKCRIILQNIKSGYVILIILLVINFSNKSPNKTRTIFKTKMYDEAQIIYSSTNSISLK